MLRKSKTYIMVVTVKNFLDEVEMKFVDKNCYVGFDFPNIIIT